MISEKNLTTPLKLLERLLDAQKNKRLPQNQAVTLQSCQDFHEKEAAERLLGTHMCDVTTAEVITCNYLKIPVANPLKVV